MSHNDDIIYEIVSALAEVEDVPPAALGYQLSNYVNPEALGNMFAANGDFWEVSFVVPHHEVTVTHAGEVFIDGMLRGRLADASPDEPTATDQHIQENLRYRQTVLHNIPSMLYRCSTDSNRQMEFVSDGCEDLTGYDPNAFIIGGVNYGTDVIHPADREPVWQSIQTAINDREPYSETYRIQSAEEGVKRVWEKGVGVFSDAEPVALVGLVTSVPQPFQ